MTWDTRRNRLQQLKTDNLCLQVIVGVTKHANSAEEFAQAASELGVDAENDVDFTLPQDYQEELFPGGYLYKKGDFVKAKLLSTQALFTLSPYNPARANEHGSSDFRKIMGAYIPPIEQAFPDLKFDEDLYADRKDLNIHFQSIVMPYTPEICHPNELGALKPITLIDGHVIHPLVSHIDDLENDFSAPAVP